MNNVQLSFRSELCQSTMLEVDEVDRQLIAHDESSIQEARMCCAETNLTGTLTNHSAGDCFPVQKISEHTPTLLPRDDGAPLDEEQVHSGDGQEREGSERLKVPKVFSNSVRESNMSNGLADAVDSVLLSTSRLVSSRLSRNDLHQDPSRPATPQPVLDAQITSNLSDSLQRLDNPPHPLQSTAILSKLSRISDAASSPLLPSRIFSPRSRRAIVELARNPEAPHAEPICVGGYLASCASTSSILELTRAQWHVPGQCKSFNGLEVGDRLLVEFQGGLSFEGGPSLDILESVVLAQSSNKQIAVIGHEKVSFSLVGGAISVKLFLMKRTLFERKFHAVSTTGQSGRAGLRIACTIKVMQGSPKSAKMDYIMNEIKAMVPRRSRILIIGEEVRGRIEISPNVILLNLGNLRHNSKISEEKRGETDHAAFEGLLRQQHFEMLQQSESLIEDLAELCNQYSNAVKYHEPKARKKQEMQELLSRLETTRARLIETDRRIATEICSDIQLIYGTINDVRSCLPLIDDLGPAATIVLDADYLSDKELGVVFALPANNIYLSIDTPFLWQRTREWKVKGTSAERSRQRNFISDEFVTRLERFISPEVVPAEFFSGWATQDDHDFALLFSCFKHGFDRILQKQQPKQVTVVKHSEKGMNGIKFETQFLQSVGYMFAMAEQYDFRVYAVSEDRETMELYDSMNISNGHSTNRKFKSHADSYVSMQGLTSAALPSLYKLIYNTRRRVVLIGNLSTLKKSDEHVRSFVNNLQSCGFVRKSLILTCPRHNTDVIFGSVPGRNTSVSWQTGCKERCNAILRCGHQCPKICHFHEEQTFSEQSVRCDQKCTKKLACGHPCPLSCVQQCSPRCMAPVDVIADCGHSTQMTCCFSGAKAPDSCARPRCQPGPSVELHRRPNLLARILRSS